MVSSTRRFLAFVLVLAGCESPTGPHLERFAQLEVASARVECSFVPGPTECLWVRWDNAESWEPLGGEIRGFTFEPGHTYVLRIAVIEWRGPVNPDQGPDYRLVHVVRKSRVPPA
jgi:hypothetical protein